MRPNTQAEIATVKSADRVFDLLELLAANPKGLAFSELVSALNIPKSSLVPLLKNIVARGYATQMKAAGVYRLGTQVQRLAVQMEAPPFLSLVAPFIEAAVGELNETCAFFVRRRDQARATLVVNGGQKLRIALSPGDEAPLYAVAAGRAMLAAARQDHRDAYLRYIMPEPFTLKTSCDLSTIRTIIDEAVSTGFAYDREEYTLGLVAVSRAVMYAGVPAGALSVAIPSARYDDAADRNIRRVLQSTTSSIEAVLNEAGYKPEWLDVTMQPEPALPDMITDPPCPDWSTAP